MADQSGVTDLLRRFAAGDQSALDQVVPLVYRELHRLAQAYLKREKAPQTLEATALVHEAYLKMAGSSQPEYQNRTHFYGIAARVMRQVLVDHARTRLAAKRGASAVNVPLDDALAISVQRPRLMIALDDALEALGNVDPDKLRLVELRYFAGLSAEEAAELAGQPVEQVRSELRTARAWLRRQMTNAEE